MLRRTGFTRTRMSPENHDAARQAQKEKNMLALMATSLRASTTAPSALAAPVPKFEYVRSKALMQSYRQLPCQNCGAADGTVCGAHSNWHQHGKGRGIKASDVYAASLCFHCHGELDQGAAMDDAQRKQFWWRAHVLTVAALVNRGLWPAVIPVPDTLGNPFE